MSLGLILILKLFLFMGVASGATVSVLASYSEDPGLIPGSGNFLGNGRGEAAAWC